MKDGDFTEKLRSSLMNNIGYELRIGEKYNYYDNDNSVPSLCELVNIYHDGYFVVYEFKGLNSSEIGFTIYPNRLKPLLK